MRYLSILEIPDRGGGGGGEHLRSVSVKSGVYTKITRRHSNYRRCAGTVNGRISVSGRKKVYDLDLMTPLAFRTLDSISRYPPLRSL